MIMRLALKIYLSGVIFCFFLFSSYSWAAEFDVIVVSGGENPTIIIQNNTDFPAYVYDLVKADGTSIGISTDVIDTTTIQVRGDITGIVEARCLAAQNSFEGWEKWLYNPAETDGLFHYTAAVVQ